MPQNYGGVYLRILKTGLQQLKTSAIRLHLRPHRGTVRSTYENMKAGNYRQREMKKSLVLLKIMAVTTKTL